jgi:hypothetical protein
MGMDLLVSLLEIDHDKEPNWAKAQEHLDSMTDDVCVDTVLNVSGADELEDVLPSDYPAGMSLADRARKRIQEAAEAVKEGWDNGLRSMTKIRGQRTTILIAAGESWGDDIEECTHMAYFDDSGCAEAAGFLS